MTLEFWDSKSFLLPICSHIVYLSKFFGRAIVRVFIFKLSPILLIHKFSSMFPHFVFLFCLTRFFHLMCFFNPHDLTFGGLLICKFFLFSSFIISHMFLELLKLFFFPQFDEALDYRCHDLQIWYCHQNEKVLFSSKPFLCNVVLGQTVVALACTNMDPCQTFVTLWISFATFVFDDSSLKTLFLSNLTFPSTTLLDSIIASWESWPLKATFLLKRDICFIVPHFQAQHGKSFTKIQQCYNSIKVFCIHCTIECLVHTNNINCCYPNFVQPFNLVVATYEFSNVMFFWLHWLLRDQSIISSGFVSCNA